jgi:hypothetical protein
VIGLCAGYDFLLYYILIASGDCGLIGIEFDPDLIRIIMFIFITQRWTS